MSMRKLFNKRFLLIWLIAGTLAVANFLFLGLGAFFALFFVFHLIITAVPFSLTKGSTK